MRRMRCSVAVALAAGMGLGAYPATAAPTGYALTEPHGADAGVQALAYGPDGTLYLAEAREQFGGSVDYVIVIPPGGARSQLTLTGATLSSVSGKTELKRNITQNSGAYTPKARLKKLCCSKVFPVYQAMKNSAKYE